MHSLSEVLVSASTSYRAYISRKTDFLLSDSRQDQVKWFWLHLIHRVQEEDWWSSLSEEQWKLLDRLLIHFGYYKPVAEEVEIMRELETKLIFLFKHPAAGYFIPLEIFKLLMQRTRFADQNYIFSLLYRLKVREQRAFVSLIGSSIIGQASSITLESHPLDMALVLFIWFANQYSQGLKRIPGRGVLLNMPFSFMRESRKNFFVPLAPEDFPGEPVPMWEFLYSYFPGSGAAIEEWKHIMSAGGKGFYRSLSLLRSAESPFLYYFRGGYFMPVIKKATINEKNVNDLRMVTPREIHVRLSQKGQVENNIKNNLG